MTNATTISPDAIPCVVLAGGLARRMGGGDKPLRSVGDRTILERVIARLAPQCDPLILNANGDPARFAQFGLAIAPDSVAGFPGPLAGILAGLDWVAAHRPNALWMMSAPGDCPFLPRDLASRLVAARTAENADLAIAASDGQPHPVIGLWRVDLRGALRRALEVDDIRQVGRFVASRRHATVAWPTIPLDPFFNANTAHDLIEAERLAADDNAQ